MMCVKPQQIFDPNKTYPFVVEDGIKEMTHQEAKDYSPASIRDMMVDNIKTLVGGCPSTSRWFPVKLMLYEMTNGPFPPSTTDRIIRNKCDAVSIINFDYSSLDDKTFLSVYDLVIRRFAVFM